MELIVVAIEYRRWWRSDLWRQNDVSAVLSNDLGSFMKYIGFDEVKPPTSGTVIRYGRG
jgi:hypothetical protein